MANAKRIVGYDQVATMAISQKTGVRLDAVDMLIFDFINSFVNSEKAAITSEGGRRWFWVSHTLIMQGLPTLYLTSKSAVIKRIAKLIAAGLLIKHPDCKQHGRTLYRFGENRDIYEYAEYSQSVNECEKTAESEGDTLLYPYGRKNTPMDEKTHLCKIVQRPMENFPEAINSIEGKFIDEKKIKEKLKEKQNFPEGQQNECENHTNNEGIIQTVTEFSPITLNTENTPNPPCSAPPPAPTLRRLSAQSPFLSEMSGENAKVNTLFGFEEITSKNEQKRRKNAENAELLRTFWNETLVKLGFPCVKTLSEQRIAKAAEVVEQMVKEGVKAEDLFGKIAKSDFLKNGCKSWFGFDWLISKRRGQFDPNWKIVYDGKYDNREPMAQPQKLSGQQASARALMNILRKNQPNYS